MGYYVLIPFALSHAFPLGSFPLPARVARDNSLLLFRHRNTTLMVPVKSVSSQWLLVSSLLLQDNS
jgi:hypothetical protein